MIDRSGWDVAVVGAGPAGLSAARAAASAGARTVVLDRAVHPRYKTCGGGLTGTSLAEVAGIPGIEPRELISAVRFTLRGGQPLTRRREGAPFLSLVDRAEFDAALCAAAVAAGAQLRQGVRVTGLAQDAGAAVVRLAGGEELRAAVVVGADGSAGVCAGHVGVRWAEVDLGLEVELPAPDAAELGWSGLVAVDWGPVPGSYGWVFPKGDRLTVGVIAERGRGPATRAYLDRFVERCGLAGRRPVQDSGHLTRCRTPDSPLRRGRVLVAGDAAGLLEPWTREGISFALRSGRWAGEVAAAAVAADGDAALQRELARYPELVAARLAPEMEVGRALRQVFTRTPSVVHRALATPIGWRGFTGFCRGEDVLLRAARHRSVRALIRVAGRAPRPRTG